MGFDEENTLTFYELCGMVRHCWRIALAIVLACTLGMGLYSLKGSAPVYKGDGHGGCHGSVGKGDNRPADGHRGSYRYYRRA